MMKYQKEVKIMIKNDNWNWSEETMKAIIQDIYVRKEKYAVEAKTDIDKGIAMGYEFVLDSIKNQLEARGYKFEDWLANKD